MVLAAPPRPRDRAQALQSAARELANAAGPQPVVAEERERILQPLRERWQWGISRWGILVQEVDPQPRGHLLLAVERAEGVVHRVGILVRDAGGGLVRVEGARVTMGGDAQPRVVLQCIEGAPLPGLGTQKLLA